MNSIKCPTHRVIFKIIFKKGNIPQIPPIFSHFINSPDSPFALLLCDKDNEDYRELVKLKNVDKSPQRLETMRQIVSNFRHKFDYVHSDHHSHQIVFKICYFDTFDFRPSFLMKTNYYDILKCFSEDFIRLFTSKNGPYSIQVYISTTESVYYNANEQTAHLQMIGRFEDGQRIAPYRIPMVRQVTPEFKNFKKISAFYTYRDLSVLTATVRRNQLILMNLTAIQAKLINTIMKEFNIQIDINQQFQIEDVDITDNCIDQEMSKKSSIQSYSEMFHLMVKKSHDRKYYDQPFYYQKSNTQ